MAYPSPDRNVRDFLTDRGTADLVRIRYHLFLTHLFRSAAQYLSSIDYTLSYESLATQWKSYLQDNRTIIYDGVIKRAKV